MYPKRRYDEKDLDVARSLYTDAIANIKNTAILIETNEIIVNLDIKSGSKDQNVRADATQ